MNSYFSVCTKDSEDQLSNAVASYIFDLISLGAKFTNTGLGIHELEYQCHRAFEQVLGDLVVCISVDATGQHIKVALV